MHGLLSFHGKWECIRWQTVSEIKSGTRLLELFEVWIYLFIYEFTVEQNDNKI